VIEWMISEVEGNAYCKTIIAPTRHNLERWTWVTLICHNEG